MFRIWERTVLGFAEEAVEAVEVRDLGLRMAFVMGRK
jgi:hypothetical protein